MSESPIERLATAHPHLEIRWGSSPLARDRRGQRSLGWLAWRPFTGIDLQVDDTNGSWIEPFRIYPATFDMVAGCPTATAGPEGHVG